MTVYVNGKVFTGRGETDFAGWFRVVDGVVDRVGRADERVEAVPTEPVVDLGGRTVLPGLLDVHTHPAMMSTLTDSIPCLPPEITSLAGLLERLGTHPNLGSEGWIEGFGYDDAKFAEGRGPTADDLDEITGTQPILVRRCDGHSAVANHRALAIAGITAATPDPPGGRYGRHPDGRLTGELIEMAATERVAAAIPAPPADRRARNLARLDRHFAERGIVAVADLLATEIPDPLTSFRRAAALGLRTRCALYYGWPAIVAAGLDELSVADRTGAMRIAGVKVFMDGAYSNRTAWTEDAYPGTCDHGINTLTDDDFHAAVGWARRNRVQVAVHAMGDRALNHVLDLVGDQEPWLGDRPSVRLDHATLFSPAMIDRVNRSRMSFGVVSHTIFLFAEYDSYALNLSPGQFEIAYPIRSFYEHLPNAALSSDNPATAWADADNVFISVQAAVTRRAYNGADIGQTQAVSAEQALLLYTGRARTIVPLGALGLIAPGCEASFVVLDRDVFTVDPDQIGDTRVEQTWIRGDLAFQLGSPPVS